MFFSLIINHINGDRGDAALRNTKALRCRLDVGGFPSEGAVRSDRSDSVEISEKITRWWIRQGGNGDVEAHEEAFCLATQAGDAVGASLGRESVG